MVDTWGGSLHQTFRLLPVGEQSANLRPFLKADGKGRDDVLAALPFDRARSGDPNKEFPDPKRYRDGKQVYQTAGLLYDEEGVVHVTELGRAVLRWLDRINELNVRVLGRHAAYALAACQLRNPTGAGQRFDKATEVFPFSFIWRAMLALDEKISSDELNRAVFKVTNEGELGEAIEKIAEARRLGDLDRMGEETITGDKKNDRVIAWVAIASFGWILIADKGSGGEAGFYKIRPRAAGILREAARIRHRHREFSSVPEYVEHVSRAAALPGDLR